MKTILITGATGFVGSACAQTFLRAGFRVKAISRNDADGCRTRTAIRAAASAFDTTPLDELAWSNFIVSTSDKLEALSDEFFADVDEVWHFAAEMTYSLRKVRESLAANVGGSLSLYDRVKTSARRCQRFYYVSTAYSVGVQPNVIVPEGPHALPTFVNSYQISKWATEVALSQKATHLGLPLTVVRPTIVIGHSASGWAGGKSYGPYMFCDGLLKLRRAGVCHIGLNLPPANFVNLTPVDYLATACLSLSSAAQGAQRELLEWVNLLGVDVRVDRVIKVMTETLGMKHFFGRPVSTIDALFNARVEKNASFASNRYRFDEGNLTRYCGELPARPTEDTVLPIIKIYLDQKKKEETILNLKENLLLRGFYQASRLQRAWRSLTRSENRRLPVLSASTRSESSEMGSVK